jgi:hypothetical protein
LELKKMIDPASKPRTLYPANAAFVDGQAARPAVLSRALPPRQAQRFVQGLLLVVAGLFLVGLIGLNVIQVARLNATGLQAPGKVIEVYARSKGMLAPVQVTFSFTPAGGQPISQVQSMDQATAAQFRFGQVVQVRYAPDAVRKARIEGTPASNWLAYMLGGAGLALAGLAWAGKPLATLLAYRRLRRSGGRVIAGQILGVQARRWLTHGAGGGFVLSYCFASPSGRQIKRTETIMSKEASPIPESALGAPIAVLYHSDRAFALL